MIKRDFYFLIRYFCLFNALFIPVKWGRISPVVIATDYNAKDLGFDRMTRTIHFACWFAVHDKPSVSSHVYNSACLVSSAQVKLQAKLSQVAPLFICWYCLRYIFKKADLTSWKWSLLYCRPLPQYLSQSISTNISPSLCEFN